MAPADPHGSRTEQSRMTLRLIGVGGSAGAMDTEKIRTVLPELDEMVTDGLITLEKVAVITYPACPPGRSE